MPAGTSSMSAAPLDVSGCRWSEWPETQHFPPRHSARTGGLQWRETEQKLNPPVCRDCGQSLPPLHPSLPAKTQRDQGVRVRESLTILRWKGSLSPTPDCTLDGTGLNTTYPTALSKCFLNTRELGHHACLPGEPASVPNHPLREELFPKI